MKLYVGIDLHANNNYLAIIDENDTRMYKRKLPNQPDVIFLNEKLFSIDEGLLMGDPIGCFTIYLSSGI